MARMSSRNTDFYGNPILRDEAGAAYNVLEDGTMDYTGIKDPSMPSLEGNKSYEEKVAGLEARKTPSSATNAGMAGAQTAIQGGNALDIASSAGMASGDPLAMGAALGLQTISAVNKSKQQREQNRYLAEVQRVKARQDAIDRLASIGQNLRA